MRLKQAVRPVTANREDYPIKRLYCMGQTCTIVEDNLQQKCMQEAGFVDVRHRWEIQSGGGWAKNRKLREIGRYVIAALEQDFEGYVLYMASQLLVWSMDEVRCITHSCDECFGLVPATPSFSTRRLTVGSWTNLDMGLS
ncbi:hypothetical protein H9L39_14765 [Fusarium oxysporum f. sp. albedinis]|nr:hypothetical protein H9L39_14765 [Fusarium oxysporum f. sp. albedinis]